MQTNITMKDIHSAFLAVIRIPKPKRTPPSLAITFDKLTNMLVSFPRIGAYNLCNMIYHLKTTANVPDCKNLSKHR